MPDQSTITDQTVGIDGTDVIVLCAGGHWWQPTNDDHTDRCPCPTDVPIVAISSWDGDPADARRPRPGSVPATRTTDVEVEIPIPAKCRTCDGEITWDPDEPTGQQPRWRHADQVASYRSAAGAHHAEPVTQPAKPAPVPFDEHERAVLEEIDARDKAQEWADRLAYAIAAYFGVEVGEHSNAENPWLNALRLVEHPPAKPAPQTVGERLYVILERSPHAPGRLKQILLSRSPETDRGVALQVAADQQRMASEGGRHDDTYTACELRSLDQPEPDGPNAGITEEQIAALPEDDLNALVDTYGLRDLIATAGEDAPLALVAARNRGRADASHDLVSTQPVDNPPVGIVWIELDAGQEQPRLVLTGDLEALRALAGRFPPYAHIEEDDSA